MRDRVWIRDLEPAFLQIIAVIEERTADEQCAFGIDDHANVRRLDHDVAVGRAIDQIHFVLQAGATTAYDRDP